MNPPISQDEPPPGLLDAPRFRPFASPNHTVSRTRYVTSSDPRGYMCVFEYPLNGHWLMVDADNGYVHWTGIWKALGNTKTDIVKIIEAQPDLGPLLRRIRGGYLKIQGTWVPYENALGLAQRVAWPIRHDLVPIFGPTFPSTCIPPDQPGYGQLVSNPTAKRRARRTVSMSLASHPSSSSVSSVHHPQEGSYPRASTSAMLPPSELIHPQRQHAPSMRMHQDQVLGAFSVNTAGPPPATAQQPQQQPQQPRVPLHIQTQMARKPPSPSNVSPFSHSPTRTRQPSNNSTQRYSPYPGTNERERGGGERYSPTAVHPHSYPGPSSGSSFSSLANALPADVSPSSSTVIGGVGSLFSDTYTSSTNQGALASFPEHRLPHGASLPRPNAIILPPLSSLPAPPPSSHTSRLTPSPNAPSTSNNYFPNVLPPSNANTFSLPPISSLDAAPGQGDGSEAVLRRLKRDDEDERAERERREQERRDRSQATRGETRPAEAIYPEPYGRSTMPNQTLLRSRSFSVPPYRGVETNERGPLPTHSHIPPQQNPPGLTATSRYNPHPPPSNPYHHQHVTTVQEEQQPPHLPSMPPPPSNPEHNRDRTSFPRW